MYYNDININELDSVIKCESAIYDLCNDMRNREETREDEYMFISGAIHVLHELSEKIDSIYKEQAISEENACFQ